ncbi:Hypothetical protein D9617_35g089910 [Elsinoe fawcettii]|nr:Hypothetical protein D9617_35g089910 [Elsinoe fawcettii]
MIDSTTATNTSYACSGLALLLLAGRMLAARTQPKPFDLSFFVASFAFVAIVARMVVSKYALHYGTINDYTKVAPTPEIIDRIRTGTVYTLSLRILLTSILWSQCLLLLLLYRRFVAHLPWMKHAINATYLFTALTFVSVVLACFLECRPISLFWQLSATPSTCVKAIVQISLQCIGNVIIDAMLIALSVPVLFIKGGSTTQRLRLAGLFSLGIFCIVINCIRLYYSFKDKSAQPTRTFWASIALLTSTFVANAPTLYGSIRLWRGEKKSSKGNSGYQNTNPTRTTAVNATVLERGEKQDEEKQIAVETVVTVMR